MYEYEESDEGEAHILGLADPDMDLAAAHTGDVVFLFPNNLKFAAKQHAFTPGEEALSKAMIQSWTSFARSGFPSTSERRWPSLGVNLGISSSEVEELTPNGLFPVAAQEFMTSHKCQFWDAIYLSLLGGAE